ncbi:hypothetical protein [Nocardiopsis sp. NPDC057823]|uniref:hypothetical protein n=1 Tax=Nocardiopsis sp. NPDC057823 TaxID=3346256 RepID=UPI00366E32A5
MTDRTVTVLKAINAGNTTGPLVAEALDIPLQEAFNELADLIKAGLIQGMPHQARYAAPETRAFRLTPAGEAHL